MRITHVTGSLSRRGAGVAAVVHALAREQVRQGSAVTVMGLRDEFTDEDLPCDGSVVYRTCRAIGPAAFGYAPDMGAAIRESAPDVIHVHGLWMYPGVAARRAAQAMERPLVVSPHGMLEPWALANSRWKKRLATWCFERANLAACAVVHAITNNEVSSIRAFGVKAPVAVIPNGVNLAEFEKAGELAADFRKAFPVVGERKMLLFLSRIHPKKGLLNLVRAWARAADAHRDWVLVIVGPDEGGHEREVRSLVHAERVDNSVVFAGPLHGILRLGSYGAASAFVLPSFSEGFSMAILEALACRLPVILTPGCNFPEVRETGAGFECEPVVSAVQAAVERLCGLSDVDRENAGKRGYELVKGKYLWSHIAAAMVGVYAWATGNGEKPEFVG